MIQRYLPIAAMVLVAVLLGAGCTTTHEAAPAGPGAPETITTTTGLIGFVSADASFAR